MTPLPYIPRMDDGLTLVLLGCFLLSAYVLSRSRKFLLQLGKDYLLHRERASIFTTSTAADLRYLSLLILQTCLLAGVCIFNLFIDLQAPLTECLPSMALLGIYSGICLLFIGVKWLLYMFLGWIFFDKAKTSLWLESFSTLLYYAGFPLYLLALLVIYLDLSLTGIIILGLISLLFAKILVLYKWLKLFCNNLHGSLLLFLYFCALEVMPYLLMYRVLLQLNEYLIIKF